MAGYANPKETTTGWKRALKVTLCIWLFLGAVVLIPLQLTEFLPYGWSYRENKEKAEKLQEMFSGETIRKRMKMQASGELAAKYKGDFSKLREINERFAKRYEKYANVPKVVIPRSEYKDWQKLIDEWANEMPKPSDLIVRGNSLSEGAIDDMAFFVLEAVSRAQWPNLTVSEKLSRLRLILDKGRLLGPRSVMYFPEVSAMIVDLLQSVWMEPAKLNQLKDMVQAMNPEYSSYNAVVSWISTVKDELDSTLKLPSGIKIRKDLPVAFSFFIKVPFIRNAPRSRIYHVQIQYLTRLEKLDGEEAEQHAILAELDKLRRSTALIDTGMNIDSMIWISAAGSSANTLCQVAAKRALDQAIAATEAFHRDGRFPTKLPLAGRTSINPLSGRPYDYVLDSTGLRIGFDIKLAPKKPIVGETYGINGTLFAARSPDPNRFEIFLKLPASK